MWTTLGLYHQCIRGELCRRLLRVTLWNIGNHGEGICAVAKDHVLKDHDRGYPLLLRLDGGLYGIM